MSKLSIYESNWLNLVFEGRNKAYGAYQLRQDSGKTTFLAFFVGLLVVSMLAVVMLLVSSNNAAAMPITPDIYGTTVKLSDVKPNKPPVVLPVKPLKKSEPLKNTDPKKPLVNPTIVKDNPDDVLPNKNPMPITSAAGSETGSGTPNAGGETGTTMTTPPVAATPSNGNTIESTVSVDVMPEFPGGIKKFLTYVGNNFEKPEIDETVTILMSFVIEKDGSMTDIKVLRNPGYGLDKEAIRVLKAQRTKWKPGVKNGQPVRVLYQLPIKVTKI